MFRAYAVDPSCFGNYENFLVIRDSFSWHHGRLISRFPLNWFELSSKFLEESHVKGNLSYIESKRIEDEIFRIKKIGLIASDSKLVLDAKVNWLSEAVKANPQIKFFRIITNKANKTASNFLSVEELLNSETPGWDIPRDLFVERSPEEIFKSASLLIKSSKIVKLIDPYFFTKDQKKWIQTLKELVKHLRKDTKIEIHTKTSREDNEKPKEINQIKSELVEIIKDKKLKFEIFIWDDSRTKKKMHIRSILSNLGGLVIEAGLDPRKDAVTYISIMGKKVLDEILSDYNRDSSTFDLVHEPISILSDDF